MQLLMCKMFTAQIGLKLMQEFWISTAHFAAQFQKKCHGNDSVATASQMFTSLIFGKRLVLLLCTMWLNSGVVDGVQCKACII